MDEDNLIAVGCKFSKQISLHKSDGSHIRTVHTVMIDAHLTTYKQRFVYTNYWNRMLYSMNYDGSTVFAANVPSSSVSYWGPNGVCCDKSGGIYVAVRGYWPANEILRYTMDGAYIGCVITGCDLPWGIALTPDEKDLVVATNDSVTIFTRAEG